MDTVIPPPAPCAGTRPLHSTQVIAGYHLRSLRAWQRPGCNLAIWQRRPTSAVTAAAKVALRSLRRPIQVSGPPTEIERMLGEELARAVNADLTALARDVARLARSFSCLVDAPLMKVSIDPVRTDQCRLFHVDRLRCRLITTYLGPATEWAANGGVCRQALGCGKNEAILTKPSAANRLEAGWVALLRGDEGDNFGNGLVHRSPPVERQLAERLVARVDPITHGQTAQHWPEAPPQATAG